MNKSSIFYAHKSTYFQILCYALERWTRVKLRWFKSSPEYKAWDSIDGNPMEFCWNISQDSPNLSSATKSKSSCQNERKARIIYRMDHLHVDIQRNLMEISGQWAGMRINRQSRFYFCQKIFTRKMVRPRTWIRKEVVFYSRIQTTSRMGQIFGVFRATSPLSRGTLISKGSRNFSLHFCADGDTIESFFAQLFLLISSVFTEQTQICVKNTVAVKQEQGDLFWQSNLTHFSRQQTYWWRHLHFRFRFFHKKIAKGLRTSGKVLTTRSIDKDSSWCRIPDNSWRRTVLHEKRHWRNLTI